MPGPRVTSAVAVLISILAGGVHAQEIGLKLRMQPSLIPYSEGGDEPAPLFLEADRMQGRQDRELEAEGSVSLRKRGYALFADHIYFSTPEQEVTATGRVRLDKAGDILTSEKLFFRYGSETGYLEKPTYRLQQFNARQCAAAGRAEPQICTRSRRPPTRTARSVTTIGTFASTGSTSIASGTSASPTVQPWCSRMCRYSIRRIWIFR
jgi:hypothetical protein